MMADSHTPDKEEPTHIPEDMPPSQSGEVGLPAASDDDDSAVMAGLVSNTTPHGSMAKLGSAAASTNSRKLEFLNLPLDILRLIVSEITHTNDLTALALTHSTLHNLAVPHIYSRFDIVWPDSSQPMPADSKSVDALTYGLSTLCLGSSFAFRACRAQRTYPPKGPVAPTVARRLQNDYAKYIKKFSLGNGPPDWVAEYMITKESGKMLGTLVALAVTKMTSLETFVWDMPTGVLSDIFMALASVQNADNESRLERVSVRWHDNFKVAENELASSTRVLANNGINMLTAVMTPVGIYLPSAEYHPSPPTSPPIAYSDSRVEFPTFSVLPPLKSLSVLDIDEVDYLDEMALVISRSQECLEELRVGIARTAMKREFVGVWDGDGLHQVDHDARWPGESRIGQHRLGGILGVLVGKVFDIRSRRPKSLPKPVTPTPAAQGPLIPIGAESEGAVQATPPSHQPTSTPGQGPPAGPAIDGTEDEVAEAAETSERDEWGCTLRRLDGKLKLKTLELERIPLSIYVCAKAFDWTLLTNLTILECAHHEKLWKTLRKQFRPTPCSTANLHDRCKAPRQPSDGNGQPHYHLALKRLHTDLASVSLVKFLKETLAPNSLEVLFLQNRKPSAASDVTIDDIFEGPIKRHHKSLKKLLLDSTERTASETEPGEGFRWLNWAVRSEFLTYLTSGRMVNLKELSISIFYRDWHSFLQRLPNLAQLRSLHFPRMAERINENFEPKELALQILDIISLRRDVELCYVGIGKKCYEILESPTSEGQDTGATATSAALSWNDLESNAATVTQIHVAEAGTDDEGAETSEAEESDEDEDDEQNDMEDEDAETDAEDDEDFNGLGTGEATDLIDIHSESDAASVQSEADSFVAPEEPSPLRLREILFYDDRVSIFKARHCRL